MIPPLARSVWPLIQAPSGPARKATPSAISCGWPRRSSGDRLERRSITLEACGYAPKPDPSGYRVLISEHGIDAARAAMIEDILKGIAPRAARPAEIRVALQRDKGASVAFTSIRHALGQLAARQVIEEVGDGKSWRIKG